MTDKPDTSTEAVERLARKHDLVRFTMGMKAWQHDDTAATLRTLAAENDALRDALEAIERAHIPSVPIAIAPVDDLEWAQRHVGTLRRMARRALKGEPIDD